MDGQLPAPKMPKPEGYPDITMTPEGYIGGTSMSGVTNAVPPVASVGNPSPPGAGEVGSGVPNPEVYHEDFTNPGALKDSGPTPKPSMGGRVNPGAV